AQVIFLEEGNLHFSGIVFQGESAELVSVLRDAMIRTGNQRDQFESTAGIRLGLNGIAEFIEVGDGSDAIMFDLEFVMIQRVATEEHARYVFFKCQLFGERPGRAICDPGWWYLHINGHITKEGSGTGYALRGNYLAIFDDFLQA